MRILFLLPDFPYPTSTGGRSKVFNELLYLSEKHQCDLLCIGNPRDIDKDGVAAALPNVRILNIISGPSFLSKKMRAVMNLVRLLPPSLASFNDKKFSREVRSSISIGNYDVIHYDIINMAQYLPLGRGIASVHSPNDATSLAYLRLAQQSPWSISKIRLLISSFLLRMYERDMYPRFTKVHVVSEVDKNYLINLHPDINVDVIPIALDMNYKNADNKMIKDTHDTNNIICTGNFVNPAISKGTQDFISEVFPLILKRIPKAKLIILGKNADDNLLEKISNNEHIEYTEFVENFQEFLLQADVVLAPDYAGAPGAKTRVLQAMGLGLPVIGTSAAFEGIPIINGEHGVVYNSIFECSKVMLDLLVDCDKKISIGKKGQRLVLDKFSLQAIGPKYENMYMSAINDSY